jgi:maltooligosyltrehalose trehalohydrolase
VPGAAAEPDDYPWERPLGARPLPEGGTRFRVWAPRADRVAIRAGGADHPLEDAGFGMREGVLNVPAGEDYWVLLDGEQLPDPASRFQPEGLRGPSRVIDTASFSWTDAEWQPPSLGELVLYELHVGTFSDAGTFEGAIPYLAGLRELGVNAIELMPVAAGPGRRGWGYDGVYLWAPHEAYGGPEGLQRLIDAAHREGIAVFLDVVYNHLGASGVQAFEAFGPYFTERYETFWGKAMNFDDADCDPVREWVIQNACQWVADYHVDGLRLDAIHAIYDTSARHVLAELTARVHAVGPRSIVIAESGLNDPRVIRPEAVGGLGFDAQWADDFHHALRVLLTGDRDGYYEEFGAVADLAKAYHRPFVHDGQYSTHRRRRFGAPAEDRRPEQFVVFDANHDQVGNRALGDRLPGEARPLAALCTLLSPFTPMLFMGEEYGEPAPFQFFTDHIDPEIAEATRAGRRREFAAFAQFEGEEVPDPQDPETFERSKLTRRGDPELQALYRDLLALRRELGDSETEVLGFDEDEKWLRVRRGEMELALNFASEARWVPSAGGELVLATAPAEVRDDRVALPGRAGAVLR